MKNIYKTLALVLLVFTWSCEQDDTVANENALIIPNEVTVNFTDANNDIVLLEDGGTVTLQVTLGQALNYDSVLTLEITSSDGSLETTPGFPEVTSSPLTVDLAAGDTSASFDFTFSDDSLSETSEVYTVSIANLESSDGLYTLDRTIIGGELVRTINVFDFLPTILTSSVGDVTINLTWDDGSDLDMRIRDSEGNDVDTGYSVTPGETVVLGAADADDSYTVSIRPWEIADSEQNWTLDFITPDGTETITGTINPSAGFWAEEFNILEVGKATSGDEVTYSLTEL